MKQILYETNEEKKVCYIKLYCWTTLSSLVFNFQKEYTILLCEPEQAGGRTNHKTTDERE